MAVGSNISSLIFQLISANGWPLAQLACLQLCQCQWPCCNAASMQPMWQLAGHQPVINVNNGRLRRGGWRLARLNVAATAGRLAGQPGLCAAAVNGQPES